jgi:hypothetical protein
MNRASLSLFALALAACVPTGQPATPAQYQQRWTPPDFTGGQNIADVYSAPARAREANRQPVTITPLTPTQKVCPNGLIAPATYICTP